MRLLFVSNLYPPHRIGGYELVCQRTADGLRGRGHQVRVLTSTHGSDLEESALVHRALACGYRPPDYFPDASTLEAEQNAQILAEEIVSTRPDVVLLWNVHGLGQHRIFVTALREAQQVATRLGDYQFWPNWDQTQPMPEANQSLLSDPRLRCIVNGKTLGQDYIRAGIPADRLAVISPSVEIPQGSLPSPPSSPPPLHLVWSGRISHRKGPDIAVEGIRLLVGKHRIAADLDIIGSGEENVLTDCMSRARRAPRDGSDPFPVRYLGMMSRDQYLSNLCSYHAMVMSPVGFESFGTACAEAMAAGVPVVASRLGGLVEITEGGKLGLLFEPGNPEELALQLRRLATDTRLRDSLRSLARRRVEQDYGEKTTLDRFEAFLIGCAEGLSVSEMPSSVPKMSDSPHRQGKPSLGLLEAVRRHLPGRLH